MDELRPELLVDLEIGLESIDLQLIHWLKYLGPHGIGNASPVFIIREVAFKQTKIVGNNHIKTTLIGNGGALEAIGFGLADRHSPETLSHGLYDIAVELERNEFRGKVSAQARLLEIRVHRKHD